MSSAEAAGGSRGDVLVTGAGHGLGRAIAIGLVARGYRVFAGDVDRTAIAALARETGTIVPVSLDVTDAASVASAVAQVEGIASGLDGVVNCAGVIAGGPLVEIEEEVVRRLLDVNVLGMVRVTRRFFPLLLARKGRVVNIGSEAGRFSGPFNGPYSMSKYAVEAYSDSLRRELSLVGMHVSIVQPGPVKTALLRRPAEMFARAAEGSRFAGALRRLVPLVEREWGKGVEPEVVAKVVIDALVTASPRHRYRVHNDRARRALEFMPVPVVDAILRRVLGAAADEGAAQRSQSK